MNNILNTKIIPLVQPQAIKDNTESVGSKGSTPATVDTVNANYASFYFMVGALDIAVAEMEVWECATSGGSYTKVTGAEFGASGLDALPAASGATGDDTMWAIHIPLLNRERYLQVYLVGGDGSAGGFYAAFCILSRLKHAAATKSDRGLAGEIIVS